MDSTFLSYLAVKKNTSIGILFTHLYQGQLPSSWKLVGTWTLPDNFVAAGPTVGFYAIDKDAEATLINNLRLFASRLPVSIIQSGTYKTENP